MKTIYGVLAIFLFSFCNSANAQYVTIPDSAFRSQLILKFPGCFNSVGQMDTSCVSILNNTVLKICVLCDNTALDATNIKNLEGLKYFKNLSEVYIWDNLLLTRLPKLPSSLKYITLQNAKI